MSFRWTLSGGIRTVRADHAGAHARDGRSRGRVSPGGGRARLVGWVAMRATPRASDLDAVGAYVDAAAALVGIPLASEHRQGVIRNLAAMLAAGELVLEFPLPDDVDVAPVFRP